MTLGINLWNGTQAVASENEYSEDGLYSLYNNVVTDISKILESNNELKKIGNEECYQSVKWEIINSIVGAKGISLSEAADNALHAEAELALVHRMKLSDLINGTNSAKQITEKLYNLIAEGLGFLAANSEQYKMCAEKALNDAASGDGPLKSVAEIALKKLETKENPVKVIKEGSGPSTSHPTSSEKSDQ